MKITVNPINKALIAVAYMSRFNWFEVEAEYLTGEKLNFCATEITTSDFGDLRFNRQFATPKYSNGKAVYVNLETSFTEDEAEKLKRLLEVARDKLEAIPQF